MDHAAAVPYLLEHTSFRGKVYMTHPTKYMMKTILLDFVKIT